MIKIFSINTELHKVTGIQKVLIDIHDGIKDQYNAKVVGLKRFEDVNPNIGVKKEDYIKLRNPFILKNSIVFLHERKLASAFYLINLLLNLKIKIIYIHHNVYSTGKHLTFLPKNIVSISDNVTKNLREYFGVNISRITKIHNGIPDKMITTELYTDKRDNRNIIKVLYPARINDVKRQDIIFEKLKNNLNPNIEIIFAGDGPNITRLRNLINGNQQFKVLGFVKDVPALIRDCDYLLLYSTTEGLPISLIEGAMCSKPLIINDVGGNLEVAVPKRNAILVTNWDNLINTINNLSSIEDSNYIEMCQESRKIYEEKFMYSNMISKYIKLIHTVAQG